MPFTVNKYINTPNTGDLSGTWGSAAVNPNMTAFDGMLGGFATISLSSATTFALSLPAGAATGLTPGAGPSQSQNALLKFTGTLTGNAVVQFTMPGFYIVHNACTVGSFYIKLSPVSGGGNSVCAPPGRKTHVFFDGTDMDYVDMPEVGAALDLHQSATTMPAWMSNCSVLPYLIKDGTVYNISTYPALGAALGSTFGGNGATTFGVPDELSRARIPVDTSGAAGRITSAGSGVNGTTMGASGGSQFVQAHTHTSSLTDSGHIHGVTNGTGVPTTAVGGTIPYGGGSNAGQGNISINSSTANITLTNAAFGTGSSANVMPVIVSFLPLVKT